ncbi:MAG: hypothetical protein OES57_17690, partial [Acidimicrobiia bacterium]|nr:hypothetical protein [Acidimicrobiia bacterium]
MRRASLRLVAIAAALMMLLAACGSDDDTTGTDDGTDSAQEIPADDPVAEDGEMTDEMTDQAMDDGEAGHDHGDTIDVSTMDPAPGLELEVLVDDKGGFNVHAVPVNHVVAPEAASTDHVEGEGHMHL